MSEKYYEDVDEGQILTPLQRGPMNTMLMMRWSAFQENWHRIHYDYPFATGHDGLPDIVVSGSWKQHMLVQMLKEWAGPLGWIWRVKYEYRGWDVAGDVLTAGGRIDRKEVQDGLGCIHCTIGIENQRGVRSTTGEAVIVLPMREGRKIPYPFVPPRQAAQDGTLE